MCQTYGLYIHQCTINAHYPRGGGGTTNSGGKKGPQRGGVFFCQNNLAKFGGVTLSKRCSYIHKKIQSQLLGFIKKKRILEMIRTPVTMDKDGGIALKRLKMDQIGLKIDQKAQTID